MKRKERKKRKLKVIGYWLLVIILLFVIGCGFRVFRGFGGSVWEGEGRVNWVMINDGVWLVSLEPENKNLVVLEIPKDTEIETTRGFGRYRIGAVYQLGELEGKGGSLLRESIQEYLGTPIDGYIRTLNTKYQILNTKSDLLKILTNLIIKRKGQTNFSRWDILRLWWEMKKILLHQIKLVHLDEIGALKSKVLIDGSRVWEVDQGRLDMWLQDNFYEPKIREENLTIGVINTTDYSGLANQVARIISNMGGRVVETGNWKLETGNWKCEVRSEKEKRETFTVRKLVKALGCEFSEEQDGDGRAEVSVLVGEEYWWMLNERW